MRNHYTIITNGVDHQIQRRVDGNMVHYDLMVDDQVEHVFQTEYNLLLEQTLEKHSEDAVTELDLQIQNLITAEIENIYMEKHND